MRYLYRLSVYYKYEVYMSGAAARTGKVNVRMSNL